MREGKALLNMADDKEKSRDDKEKPKAVSEKAKGDRAVKVGKKSARSKPSTRPQTSGENGPAKQLARSKGTDKGTDKVTTATLSRATTEPNKVQSFIHDLKKYLKAVKAEFHRVTWPTRQELRAATIVVIVILIVVTFYLFVVNSVLNTVFEKLVS